jgi:RNA polymerase sigma factor (sigma-70 family)
MKLRNTINRLENQSSARENAILQNLDLVKSTARRFQRRVPPCVTFDDLSSAGTIGLIQAVDRFDQTRGLKFNTYAQHRIWGAMQDFLRDEDPLSRTERKRVRDAAPSLTATGYGNSAANVSLDDIHPRCLAAPESTSFVVRSELQAARGQLSDRENRVVTLLYDFGWHSREVGTDLGVNESRVSQIKQRALSKLRLQLESVSARAA